MKTNHNYYLNLAFNIAENHLGKTRMNPSVGCVVVKNDSVISSGLTSINGRPHAEFNALNKKLNFKGCSLYTTLEPCTHYGVTPPCTNIIKNKKINKVYYRFNDPDARTFKKAKSKLKRNRINVKKISFKKNDFYKGYYLNKIYKLPLIDAKIAFSKDFKSINKKSKWITNKRSRIISHLIRSKYDCIISTSKTINKDNSMLNCRINGLDNFKPDLIIIDRKLKLKKNLKLLNITRKRKTYILTLSKNDKKIFFFQKKGIKVIKLKNLNSKRDFKILLDKIFYLGKSRALIEAGMTFINKFIKYKFINDFYIFKSNRNLNMDGSNNSKVNYLKNYSFKNEVKVNLFGDQLFKIRIN